MDGTSGVEVTVQRLSVQLRAIKQVYRRVGEDMAAWWAEQSQEQRQEFLLVSVGQQRGVVVW